MTDSPPIPTGQRSDAGNWQSIAVCRTRPPCRYGAPLQRRGMSGKTASDKASNSTKPRGTGGLEKWNGQCHEDIDRVPDAITRRLDVQFPATPANRHGRSNESPPARGIQGAARSAPWPGHGARQPHEAATRPAPGKAPAQPKRPRRSRKEKRPHAVT